MKEEIYRVYVTSCLGTLIGTDVDYYRIAYSVEPDDFDAEKVVDGVIARMELEDEPS